MPVNDTNDDENIVIVRSWLKTKNETSGGGTEKDKLKNFHNFFFVKKSTTALIIKMDMERKVLHWSYHNLRELPQELSEDLKEVEDLYLKENFIPSLPKWFFAVQSIRFLQLSGNLLEEIPPEIGKLTQLDFLDVSKNSLTSLPESIGLLTRLERLYLSENPMRRLPRGEWPSLSFFTTDKTAPLSFDPLWKWRWIVS